MPKILLQPERRSTASVVPPPTAGGFAGWFYFLRHAEELDIGSLPVTLNTPEIHRALEELNVLSQNHLERESYLAGLKMR